MGGALTPLRFILIIDEKVEITTVEEKILSVTFFTDILDDIQFLSAVEIMFVDFDETKMSNNQKTKLEVQEHLQKIDGVATIEDNNNDEKEEEIGVSNNIDTIPGDDNDKESEEDSSLFSSLSTSQMVSSLITGIYWH